MNIRFLKNKFKIIFKCYLYLLIDSFVNLYFFIFVQSNKTKTNKILLSRIDNLGDFICSLEFINKTIYEFKKKYKNKKIVFLCNKFLEDFIKSLNIFDEVISVDADKIFFGNSIFKIKINFRNIIYRIKTLITLKKTNYEIIIHLNDKYTTLFLLKNFFSKNKFSFFYSKNFINSFLNIFYKNFFHINETNEIKKLNIFYNKIFNKEINFNLPTLTFKNPNLDKYPFLKNKNYCILGVGASEKTRIWNIQKFAILAKKIIFWKKLFIVLIGTKNEFYLGENFLKYINENDKQYIVNLIGKTDILDLCNIINFSKFLIGNDSGYIHVANSLNIPSIALVPGNNWERFLPYKIRNYNKISPICLSKMKKCKKYLYCQTHGCSQNLSQNSPFLCIWKINIKDVLNEINKLNF